jgi:LPXTG-motif cell wall-anchored protein
MTNAEIDQAIYDTAIEQGFNSIAAKLIAAQARFESADYTSYVFKQNNNTSGIKYIGASQINAHRGTPAPANEQTCGGRCNGDYYAAFDTIQDCINDKIVRLYNITLGGVTPEELKNATDATEFATLLKKRSYYGPTPYGTSQATKDIENYASGMKAKLFKINVLEFYTNNKTTINLAIVGVLMIGTTLFLFKRYKKL